MKRILVTGANKGIGLATVSRILTEHRDTFVLLATRSVERGEQARNAVMQAVPDGANRLEVVRLDVSDPTSVEELSSLLDVKFGKESLYGLVNNAGIHSDDGAERCFDVNIRGIQRVTNAVLPYIQDGGAVVNVTSASGPMFVASCSPARVAQLTNPEISAEEIDSFLNDCISLQGRDDAAYQEKGLGKNVYGMSKAAANAFTLYLARIQPRLRVHSVTPGYIETDMTRPFAKARGTTPENMGMKKPSDGAFVVVEALLSDHPRYSKVSGRYFGSDGRRSPLDRYRGPGDPEYDGSD